MSLAVVGDALLLWTYSVIIMQKNRSFVSKSRLVAVRICCLMRASLLNEFNRLFL